ncbi:hypothetical protein GGI25_003475 [Coemansia spiralis]|uniref:DASH complex subunit SPC19 n=2 Tax=Coemansia TaxID=4863 RepID=A0A9W8G6N1_9FUNG|nr:hypothetical protein BX070DRAFT_253111 [Coemansia spiralis]KAJ1991492.1 hypothetical protein EDC05_003416 [Coemansia umbellata]KAJ2621554.1 hypothetical protein GGI26_004017 [Coemansia sp. RSA 1358]KAJ2676723.1 hypothetical protein GGI25_003475 [Coemansia spiralis]
MTYLNSLEQCVFTLEQCNDSLQHATLSLASLTKTFPRVETVIRCEKKYDLTTASDINKAQNLISKEAVPFLFRQVDQLESAIEAIRAAHEALEQKVEDQLVEHKQLVQDEAAMGNVQSDIKKEQATLSDVQANLLNAKSLMVSKERDLAELQRARSTVRQQNTILEQAGKVDAEIIKVRRMIADIDHETAAIPADDQIQDTNDTADKYLVLNGLRDQLAQCTDAVVDKNMAEFIDNSMATLDLLENKVFIPWWDANTGLQTERMGYNTRLLRFFFKEHGSTMQAIMEILLDHQSLTIDELRRELSATGHATTELPMLVGHLKKIHAISTDTKTAAGKQAMILQLDFEGLEDGEDIADNDADTAMDVAIE